jgi:hypothetical protein
VSKQKTNIPKSLSKTVNLANDYLVWQIIDATIKPDDAGKANALNSHNYKQHT